jgi:sulfatase modifying factor 1
MPDEADLLKAIECDPADALVWLALADCLEENGEDERAELVRLREWCRFADLDDPHRPEKEQRLGTLLRGGVKPSVPTHTVTIEEKISLTVALIPPGTFWMGSAPDDPGSQSDEFPRHKVTLTKPFWIGVTSVTRAQWQAVNQPQSGAGPNPAYPVQNTWWSEANKFCKRLGKITGGTFRLPSEAEWEYACRSGIRSSVYLGDLSMIDEAAWHGENSNDHTHAVGKKTPNAWGLYDMLGNIWDWCADGERVYKDTPVTDPLGPDGPRRVVKGGAWRSSSSRCRASARFAEEPRRRADDQGLRVVLDWE